MNILPQSVNLRRNPGLPTDSLEDRWNRTDREARHARRGRRARGSDVAPGEESGPGGRTRRPGGPPLSGGHRRVTGSPDITGRGARCAHDPRAPALASGGLAGHGGVAGAVWGSRHSGSRRRGSARSGHRPGRRHVRSGATRVAGAVVHGRDQVRVAGTSRTRLAPTYLYGAGHGHLSGNAGSVRRPHTRPRVAPHARPDRGLLSPPEAVRNHPPGARRSVPPRSRSRTPPTPERS